MTKGRQPPPKQTDLAAAAEAFNPGVAWETYAEVQRVQYRAAGKAVLDAITIQRRGIRGHFEAGSGYSSQRSEPYVEIVVDLSPAQFSPAKAREIGLLLLECAESAESDALIMAFADSMDLDRVRAAQLLDLFRQQRESRRSGKVDAA